MSSSLTNSCPKPSSALSFRIPLAHVVIKNGDCLSTIRMRLLLHLDLNRCWDTVALGTHAASCQQRITEGRHNVVINFRIGKSAYTIRKVGIAHDESSQIRGRTRRRQCESIQVLASMGAESVNSSCSSQSECIQESLPLTSVTIARFRGEITMFLNSFAFCEVGLSIMLEQVAITVGSRWIYLDQSRVSFNLKPR